jgi:hypothetical protein
MVPVPAVAGETGGVEAHDGADFAGAEAGDEPLEARACYSAAGGSTEIVVYDLDLAKTPAAGVLDEIVLAALALAMDLHLGLGGLSHIHDRLAAEDSCR